jgi:hypothetical protein
MRFAMKLFSLLLFATAANMIFAQLQQSENFRITKSVLDAGGGVSTSTNFAQTSAFGQPTPIGVSSSANFLLSAGFLSPSFAVSPASPIDVVIKRQPALSTDMKLDWSAIPSADSYTIYRDPNPLFTPGPGNQIGTSTSNLYLDSGAVNLPGFKYYYIVTAVSGGSPMARFPNDGTLRKSGFEPVSKSPSVPLHSKDRGSGTK